MPQYRVETSWIWWYSLIVQAELNPTLLAVFAHPDDEVLIAGTLAHYRAKGVRVAMVYATRGEEGKIAPGVQATRETLGQVRERELRTALGMVGIDEIYFLGFHDSGMAGTKANKNPGNFLQADLEGVVGQIMAILDQVQPQVVITFGPDGDYGHPDHLKIHEATMQACLFAPRQPPRVYWTGFSQSYIREFAAWQSSLGMPDEGKFPPSRGFSEGQISVRMDVSPYLEIKKRLRRAHASQQNPASPYTAEWANRFDGHFSTEYFVQAYPEDPSSSVKPKDLFHGLDLS